jgi:chromosome segregation protein
MRLDSLEINGFKSFPDRAHLAFDRGVTAIVGPNGCGKSNVVDAITWVLGEQSAKSLRGDRMEDVIFSGSDARKPTAAAEVRLALSGVASSVASLRRGPHVERETDHRGHAGRGAEAAAVDAGGNGRSMAVLDLRADDVASIVRDVQIARRLYRSGESEYLIDGEVCRLRDVHDLLMDAGLGTKGYAVIEQGKIGQILSARPTDRRQLIEEAAGVTKYKSRRRAAELKLEAAQQNLTRVDDIIFEVEKQRGALKRQAAKARRYRRLRDELRRWERVLFARRFQTLARGIEAARARLAEARALEAAAAAAVSAREGRMEQRRLELVEAETAATAARETAHARELELGARRQQIEFDRQQVEALAASLEHARQELEGLETRRGPAREELAGRRSAAEHAARERDAAEMAMRLDVETHAAAHAGIEGLEADVEAARSEVFAAINAATALRHAIDHAATAIERLVEEIARLDVEDADARVEADKAAADRSAAEAALTRGREALAELWRDRRVRESELAAARTDRERIGRELRAREDELTAARARLRSLEELDASRAEYGDAARLLLAEAPDAVAQLGSVADYVDVERRYERAVESCLGDLLQHVLVPTRAHAEAGLAIARDRDAGRCGFLIVEPHGVSARSQASGSTKPSGGSPEGLVPLRSVIRLSGPYADAIAAAIGNAWLADTLERAAAAALTIAAPVVTLAGEVCRGSLVTGGVKAGGHGILTTRNEIRELRDRVAAESSALERLTAEVAALDVTIAHADAAVSALESERHRQEKSVVALELQHARAVEECDRLGLKRAQIAVERRRADEERASVEARQAEARTSITRLETNQRDADERLNDAQRVLFEARGDLDTLGRRVADARARHAALAERAVALDGEIRRLEEAQQDLAGRIASHDDEIRTLELRREALRAAVAAAVRQLDDDLRAFDEARRRLQEADDRLTELRNALQTEEDQGRGDRRGLDEARAVAGELDVRRATAEAEIAHLAESCMETLQATLDEVAADVARMEETGEIAVTPAVAAETEPEEGDDQDVEASAPAASDTAAGEISLDQATAERRIADLKGRVDRLGPVNMMAIEQFDELESRHGFLSAQRQDLIDSIGSTNDAIRRIDRTTRERFREAFDAINANFQETFSVLFGGGRAGLVLLDEDDLLESGIDIIAQPPGKRLQNVQLLSGGEKAMSAMALMFAIFRYRPSPFCLLDEIDAPLDDANIGRFIDMLRGMQRETQFILITHNRKTMEIADRLYGVTMEEPGVSKLISIKLN